MKNKISAIAQFLYDSLKAFWLFKVLSKLYTLATKNTYTIIVSLLCAVLLFSNGYNVFSKFKAEYDRLNSQQIEEEKEEPGLEFKQIDGSLYTLTGSVKDGDCDKIVPLMPESFTVILESPGGNLAEGSCLAAHIKLRNVVTVVRDTPVINENGKVIYQPSVVTSELNESFKDRTMCASACSLMFVAGDKRYLIGDVLLGIHGPGTPPEVIGSMHPIQLESSAYRTAANLLRLLEQLGVEDPDLRRLFIQIPNQSMYWLNPRDFETKPSLINLATDYRNFWGLTASNPIGGLD
jgi:hypothetical protein